MANNLNAFEDKMKKTISVLENEMKTVRAGRANPAILDKVSVEYYGAPSPLTTIANVSVPDARSILVQPWDASILGDIEKAALKVISIPQNESDIEEMYSDGYDEESVTSKYDDHLKSIIAE